MLTAIFVVTAAAILVGAISVVTGTDMVRSVLWLAVTLIGTAVLYVLVQAEFIAAVQVLLYAGGIITLMLFGVMLTARITGVRISVGSHGKLRGAIASIGLFLVMAWGILSSPLPTGEGVDPEVLTAERLGEAFLVDWVLPMEVLSVLLMAVMIGAIVLARKEDPS